MSALHRSAAEYLAIRRAGGFILMDHDRLLADFADYLEQEHATWVTVQAAMAWATLDETASIGVLTSRLSAVRRFARYMRSLDERTEVPPVNLLPARRRRRNTPYLYSSTEIGALMTAASSLHPAMKAATFTTLIGVMAATGLRTREATDLGRHDVDLDGRVIVIRHTKFDKSRLVPIHRTTAEALGAYAEQRDEMCQRITNATFLVSEVGGRLNGSVSVTFRRLLADANITVPPGRRPPRLSDLRHSFAVATLVTWYGDGADVQARLPILSTYMGHLGPRETYWYLEDTPELMAAAALRLEAFLGDAT